jgi:hypothetical protein
MQQWALLLWRVTIDCLLTCAAPFENDCEVFILSSQLAANGASKPSARGRGYG